MLAFIIGIFIGMFIGATMVCALILSKMGGE